MGSNILLSEASFLTLPIETRFMIYDLVVVCTGSLVVFSQYELTKNVDKQTIHLLHVNRLIRTEIQEYFYKSQKFQFRSFQAMEKFLNKIGPYHTSIIKKVEIGSWFAQRVLFEEQMTPLLEQLTGIDQFAILSPAHGFVTNWSEAAELGHKAVAVIRASKRLAAGKVYLAWLVARSEGEVRFVAHGVQYPAGDNFAFSAKSDWYASRYPHGSPWIRYVEVATSGYLERTEGDRKFEHEAQNLPDKFWKVKPSFTINYPGDEYDVDPDL